MNRSSTPPAPRVVPLTPRGQRTRGKLLRAAETLFGEKGYEHASIADITREAQVALGTFYVYFPDKQSIFVEVVDDLGARLRRLIAEAVAECEDRMAVEREGLRAFFRFASQQRHLYRIVRQAEFVDEACYRRYYDRFARGYVTGLKKAMDAGEVHRLDPETIAYCLMGLGDFLGMRWVLWEGDAGLEQVVDTAMAFIRHGLEARPARPAPAVRGAAKRRAGARAPRSKG
ncbi:TetR/AcrR family transcriptional regulator [Archangium primigenium]|uniref:TetR/AcrR family transcriptional regulator n=1 Tax=[Archangium] primigenium TaxID=2792470 RepID=UPI00195C5D52|nr:TetR/AcrR family transcriptional regulator [Archangium primigenium]MBM7112257.1 TetR/AcrR family transcriptional regulator [Archangium primigenium]